MDIDLEKLNEQFSIPGQISFQSGIGGLVTAEIHNAHAAASISLIGGHVLTYTPHGSQPLLWFNPGTAYQPGKALRGGVPVCWPWFANQVEDASSKPVHGFVRTMPWSVKSTRALPDGATELCLWVSDTPETHALWPHAFALELAVSVGEHLRVAWTARNPGSEAYTYSGAFHPYFAVSDIHSAALHGLDGVDYLDKTDGFKRKTQSGPLNFVSEVDYIYLDTTAGVALQDPGLGRTIRIAKSGSQTTVVWNPYEKDALSPDIGAGRHREFFCAEAANAANDVVTVAPGGEARLEMDMWIEPLS